MKKMIKPGEYWGYSSNRMIEARFIVPRWRASSIRHYLWYLLTFSVHNRSAFLVARIYRFGRVVIAQWFVLFGLPVTYTAIAARNRRFVQDAWHNGQAADNGVVSDGLGLLSISLPSSLTPLYPSLSSLSLSASSTHPLFPFSPFSLFLSLYIHRLPPSRSSFFLPSSPSTFIFLNSPPPSPPVSPSFLTTYLRIYDSPSLSLSLSLPPRSLPLLYASLSIPRGSVKCKRSGSKPTKRSLAPALTEHLPPSSTIPTGKEREREGERRKRSSANDICNDLSPPSRASRREPFEQPHTSVTYFFFSLFLFLFFFFFSFPLSFFRGNGIFKSLVGREACSSRSGGITRPPCFFYRPLLFPLELHTHTHTVA